MVVVCGSKHDGDAHSDGGVALDPALRVRHGSDIDDAGGPWAHQPRLGHDIERPTLHCLGSTAYVQHAQIRLTAAATTTLATRRLAAGRA